MKFVLPILLMFAFHCTVASQTPAWFNISAYSRDQADVCSFISNPAALMIVKEPAVALYAERTFLLPELNHYSIVAALPVSAGAFGMHVLQSGGTAYAEFLTGLAYARKLTKVIDAGVRFNYYGLRAAGYGQSSAIGFSAGAFLQLTTKLRGGICAANPVGARFGKDRAEKIPGVYSFGLGYDASEKCFIGMEIEKMEELPLNVHAGFQYAFHKRCFFRAGISSATGSMWGGAGLVVNICRFDVTCSYHPQLGLSPGLLLLFRFKKKQK